MLRHVPKRLWTSAGLATRALSRHERMVVDDGGGLLDASRTGLLGNRSPTTCVVASQSLERRDPCSRVFDFADRPLGPRHTRGLQSHRGLRAEASSLAVRHRRGIPSNPRLATISGQRHVAESDRSRRTRPCGYWGKRQCDWLLGNGPNTTGAGKYPRRSCLLRNPVACVGYARLRRL